MDISLASPDDLPAPSYDPSLTLTDGPPSTIGDPGESSSQVGGGSIVGVVRSSSTPGDRGPTAPTASHLPQLGHVDFQRRLQLQCHWRQFRRKPPRIPPPNEKLRLSPRTLFNLKSKHKTRRQQCQKVSVSPMEKKSYFAKNFVQLNFVFSPLSSHSTATGQSFQTAVTLQSQRCHTPADQQRPMRLPHWQLACHSRRAVPGCSSPQDGPCNCLSNPLQVVNTVKPV